MSAAILSGPPLAFGPDAPATLAEAIRSSARDRPDDAILEIGAGGQRRSASNAQLLERAVALEPALRAMREDGASHVVVCVDSIIDFVVAASAAVFAGCDIFPWHMGRTGEAEAAFAARIALIRRRLSRPALVTTRRIAALFDGWRDAFPAGLVVIDDVVAPGVHREVGVDRPPRDVAFLTTTSGTTADPKIVVISGQATLYGALRQSQRLRGRIGLSVAPLDTSNGPIFLCRAAPLALWIHPDRFVVRPLEVLAAIAETGAQTVGLTSSFAAMILDALDAGAERFDLRSLRVVTFGAEMVVPDIVRRLADRLSGMGATDLRVTFAYGSTEAGLMTRTDELDPSDPAALPRTEAMPPRVGPPQPGVAVRIVGDRGEVVADGAIGEIEVLSPARMFDAYLGEPAATEASFTADGWFRTGDRGAIVDGEITIVGRQKAIIIVNGRNVALDAIETPLRTLPGIERAKVAAVPVRRPAARTDELAVFFVPAADDPEALRVLAGAILQATARATGVGVRHLVPLAAADFPLTATGKVRRDALAQGYLAGRWDRYVVPPTASATSAADGVETRLAAIWQAALGLGGLPGPQDDFFALGGDSLASSDIVFAVEESFGCVLPLTEFFATPTLAAMARIVDGLTGRKRPATDPPAAGALLHRIQAFTASWRGARRFPDALVIGANTTGSAPPLFWVFQNRSEFEELALCLGPDRPLYGMRSLAGVARMGDHAEEMLDTLANRYLWEILAIAPSGPIVLAGNCAGALLALHLARRLEQVGRAPALLVLLEWSFDRGRYDAPTLLLYGSDSVTAAIFAEPQTRGPDWRRDFPDRTVVAIPGTHGQFFTAANLPPLANALIEATSRIAAGQP